MRMVERYSGPCCGVHLPEKCRTCYTILNYGESSKESCDSVTGEWQRSLFRARKQLIAFIILTGAFAVLAGVITVGSLAWTSMNTAPATNPASQQFTSVAKLQAVTDGMGCLKIGSACPDFDHMAAYLGLLIQDSTEFSTPTDTAVLVKNPAGWKSWATEVTKGTFGSPTGIHEDGSGIAFQWGKQTFTATFAAIGNETRLTKLVRGNDVP